LERVLASLQVRISSFVNNGNIADLVSDEADADADEVWQVIKATAANASFAALQTLGAFYWCRFAARKGSTFLDLFHAMQLFRPLYPHRPDVVPDYLRELLASEVSRDELLAWESRAAELLHSSDPAAVDEAVRLLDQAVKGCPVDSPDYPRLMFNMSKSLWARFET